MRGGDDAPYAWNGPAFFELLPPPAGRTVDLGCGEGRTTRELRSRGYAALGVDPAPTLVRLAREADPGGAFMVLQDLRDLDGAVAEAARVLVVGGRLCFAIPHPVASAGAFLDDERFAVDSYFEQAEPIRPLGPLSVRQFHRPFEAYSRALERHGLLIEAVRELPTRRRAAGRVPSFLHVRAAKG